jgi:mRNA-degrading endonuclease toxin of MazEF toxin-antitoxin module
MPVVVVAAMTSKIKRYQTVVTLPAGNPLPRAGQILAFQVTTLDKTRLKKYLGSLTSNQIVDLKRALRIAWDL